jgi:hypothetical protein
MVRVLQGSMMKRNFISRITGLQICNDCRSACRRSKMQEPVRRLPAGGKPELSRETTALR